MIEEPQITPDVSMNPDGSGIANAQFGTKYKRVDNILAELGGVPAPQAEVPAAPVEKTPAKGLTIESNAPAAERPAWLPSKFKSPEDMARAYGELETRLGQPKAPETPKAGEKPAEGTPPPAPEQLTPLSEGEFRSFADEVISQGKLSDASYKSLEKRGLARQVVDDYIAGQNAIRDNLMKDVFATTGGEEGYSNLTVWAKANLSSEELDLYNAEVGSGHPSRVKFAVQNLQARHVSATGRPAQRPVSRFAGNRSGAAGSDRFASMADFRAAQRDPRYKTSPAYQAKVMEMLARSGNI